MLVARLLGVRRVFLLASERTEAQAAEVLALLPGLEVHHARIPADDLEAILHEALRVGRRLEGPLALDMTGGTKVMAAAMALAAERLGADLYYLASRSAKALRRPVPGSERLVLVRNFGK